MKNKILIYFAISILLGILANWFWFPEYLFMGLIGVTALSIVFMIVIAIINTVKEIRNK